MSFFSILGNLIIGPLKLAFEVIYNIAYSYTEHPGLSIIFLSLVMNILVLPLYRRADAMQEAARDTENKLSRGVAHIKKTFSGDERMMILQTYYRQNNYKPTNALNGSVSLLLEIPFFMAAYQFLSHLEILKGVSFGPIKDLGAPDGLIVIGGIAINLLPILMTLVNVISSALYLKGYPLKTKIQLYAMALFFLVFLYTSPSALVFYWTLNNVFSLVKTIFYKLKHPKEVLRVLTAVIGVAFAVYALLFYNGTGRKTLLLILIGAALQLPWIAALLGKLRRAPAKERAYVPNKKLFILGGLFLTVLIGFVIPSAYIAASPQEYVDISYYHNPLWYIVSSASMAAGFFLVWFGVFYWLANDKFKVIFDRAVWVLCGVAVVNYMFFGTDLGVISSTLKFDNGLMFDFSDQLINLAVLAAVAAVFLLVVIKFKKVASGILAVTILALAGMGTVNTVKAGESVASIENSEEASEIHSFTLSTTGKNVMVIMLDRAISEFVPYIFNEKPELVEKFDGFTNYPNTLSFGGFTNFGTPTLFGGYEYTPVEMNKRDGESLASKQNEAILMMPRLFSESGYKVTVSDPVYANYKWISDLSVFDQYPDIDAYISKGKFGDVSQKQAVIDNNKRNFFCFGLMKSMPLTLQTAIYDDGTYNQVTSSSGESAAYAPQEMDGMSKSTGMTSSFMESYNVMLNLPSMTKATEDSTNTFMYFTTDLTHEPMLLSEPDYVPRQNVDNTEYDAAHTERFTVDGKSLNMETGTQMMHYHTNMAAMIKLGDWFDHLRDIGVYDNTRIILVADHGRDLGFTSEVTYTASGEYVDTGLYHPLLMIKDFGSTGFTTSEEFMTNADVPTVATAGLIDFPTNPFTGKAINSDEKTAHDQYVIRSFEFSTDTNNGTQFHAAPWASVKGDMRDMNSWTFYEGDRILTENKAN